MKTTISILLSLIPLLLLAQSTSIKVSQDKMKTEELIVMIECANNDDIHSAGIVIGRTQSELLVVSAGHNFNRLDSSTLLTFLFKNIGNGISLEGKIVRLIGDIDKDDLALLKVKIPKEHQYLFCDLKFNQLGEESTLRKDNKISAVGNGNREKWSKSQRTDDVLSTIGEKFILFKSVDIIDGFSGGGLLNANGHLIGMILETAPPKAYRLDRILDTVTSLGYEIDLDYALPNGMNRLHDAVQKVNTSLIKKFLEDCPEIDIPDDNGATALHYATFSNRDSALPILLKAGFDPKIKDKKGEWPIHWSIENRNLKIVKKLFELNTTFYLDSVNSYSLMQKAIKNDHKIANYLKQQGISLSLPKGKDTMLINAVNEKNLEKVKTLLKYGANPNQRGFYYPHHSLVLRALYHECPKIAETLIAFDADLKVDAYHIAHWAISHENIKIIKAWLEEEGNNPFITHTTGASGTSSSIIFKVYFSQYNPKLVKVFTDKGYGINTKNKNGDTFAHTIMKNWEDDEYIIRKFTGMSSKKALEHIISLGADLSIKNKEGKTPLDSDYIKSEKQYNDVQSLINNEKK